METTVSTLLPVSQLMFVTVVDIRIMRMLMAQALMLVAMGVGLPGVLAGFVLMLMMFIMDVLMFVLEFFVGVLVLVVFGEVEVDAGCHAQGGGYKAHGKRFTKKN